MSDSKGTGTRGGRRSEGPRWPVRAAAGAGLLAATWRALARPAVQRADVRAGDVLRRAGSPPLDRLVTSTTDLGSVYAVLGISAALAAAGRRRTALDVLGLGLVAWSVAQGSKTRVRRQRPYEADGVRRLVRPPTGSSFPSGHAAVGVAVMSLLAEHGRSRSSRALLGALAAYVPLSRVYVGVHYPTDVIGGAGLGMILAALWRGPVAAVPRAALLAALTTARLTGEPALRDGLAVLAGRAPARRDHPVDRAATAAAAAAAAAAAVDAA